MGVHSKARRVSPSGAIILDRLGGGQRARARDCDARRRDHRAPLARPRAARPAVHVRQTIVRGKVVTPKSRSARRTMELGPRTAGILDEVWKARVHCSDDSLVFGHPSLGSPIDPTKLSRDYMRPALKAAGITKPFRPWHDLRHTALTHEAAAGNRTPTFRRRPDTVRARSPTATSTPPRCSSPAPPRRPRRACSAPPGSKTGSKTRRSTLEREKPRVSGAFL